jgi:hypothetical protein
LADEVRELGLKISSGNTLERASSAQPDEIFDTVKRNVVVDYGEFRG